MTESELWTFTFPVLKEKIFAIFWMKKPRNISLWVLLTRQNLHFPKIRDVLVKTFDYKSKDQNSGCVLWILDKSLNLLGLGLRFLTWKKGSWWPVILKFAFVLPSRGCFVKSSCPGNILEQLNQNLWRWYPDIRVAYAPQVTPLCGQRGKPLSERSPGAFSHSLAPTTGCTSQSPEELTDPITARGHARLSQSGLRG